MPDQRRFAVVAVDVDGTLIDYHERASPRVVAALRDVADAGAQVVLATGKSMFAAQNVIDRLGLTSGWCVASNGAVVFHYPPPTVSSPLTFDPGPIVASALERSPEAIIAVEVVGEGYRLNREFPPDVLAGRMWLESVEELVREPVTRLLIRDPLAPPHDYQGFAADGVTKSSALATLVVSLGHSSDEVLAIGDGHNDIDMLVWAGRGVAMGHAHDDVKAAADEETGSLEDDGVATELARWFRPSTGPLPT